MLRLYNGWPTGYTIVIQRLYNGNQNSPAGHTEFFIIAIIIIKKKENKIFIIFVFFIKIAVIIAANLITVILIEFKIILIY